MGALLVKLVLRRERNPQVWVDFIGTPLLMCLFIAGWHYMKLWRDYGNPFTGNWDSAVIVSWWQYKGLQTPGYFFSFGDSLIRPFFSGLHSFWDGLYSTLWGDGLLGGSDNLWTRSPWNYDLMAVGFVLALVPTVLALTGLMRALAGCFRSATLPWLMLMAIGWLFAFAILSMSLKVPSYAQAKAFYGLPVLLPFCALGALGFEFWAGRGKVARYVLGVAVGIWLVNLYASFWIRPNTIQSEVSSAIGRLSLREDHSEVFLNFLRRHPGNIQATGWLASLESRRHPEQAVKRLEQAVKDGPADARIENSLARSLALCDRLDEGIVHAKRAVELAPEDEVPAQTLCSLEARPKSYEDAVAAGRHALSINPTDLGTHFNLGVALINLGQTPEAASHFSAVVDSRPLWADAQFFLGRCLLDQPGKRDEGLAHLREAVRLNPTNTEWQAMLKGK